MLRKKTNMLVSLFVAIVLLLPSPALAKSQHDSLLFASLPMDGESGAPTLSLHASSSDDGTRDTWRAWNLPKDHGGDETVVISLTYRDGTNVADHIQQNTGSRQSVDHGKSAIKATFRCVVLSLLLR